MQPGPEEVGPRVQPPHFISEEIDISSLPWSLEAVTAFSDQCKGKGSPLARRKEKGDCHLHAVSPLSCCDPGRTTIPTAPSKASSN